jgi:hypothetical protein
MAVFLWSVYAYCSNRLGEQYEHNLGVCVCVHARAHNSMGAVRNLYSGVITKFALQKRQSQSFAL